LTYQEHITIEASTILVKFDGGTHLWFILWYYTCIWLEEIMKTMKNSTQDNQSTNQDLSPGYPEYEAEGLYILIMLHH
jgi:hypothetical protein